MTVADRSSVGFAVSFKDVQIVVGVRGEVDVLNSGPRLGIAVSAPLAPQVFDNEIRAIETALDEHGATEQHELAQMVGARYWGPGVFRDVLREAVAEGRRARPTRQPERMEPATPNRAETVDDRPRDTRARGTHSAGDVSELWSGVMSGVMAR